MHNGAVASPIQVTDARTINPLLTAERTPVSLFAWTSPSVDPLSSRDRDAEA